MKTIALAAALVAMVGCAQVKDLARTAKDIGIDLCRMHFSERPEDQAALGAPYAGMSVKDLCAVAEIVNPFVDGVLSAQSMASTQLGVGGEGGE